MEILFLAAFLARSSARGTPRRIPPGNARQGPKLTVAAGYQGDRQSV